MLGVPVVTSVGSQLRPPSGFRSQLNIKGSLHVIPSIVPNSPLRPDLQPRLSPSWAAPQLNVDVKSAAPPPCSAMRKPPNFPAINPAKAKPAFSISATHMCRFSTFQLPRLTTPVSASAGQLSKSGVRWTWAMQHPGVPGYDARPREPGTSCSTTTCSGPLAPGRTYNLWSLRP